jgi:hypothetical protein
VLARLDKAGGQLDAEEAENSELLFKARSLCSKTGLRLFARLTGVDPGNLSSVLAGRRSLSAQCRSKLEAAIQQRYV